MFSSPLKTQEIKLDRDRERRKKLMNSRSMLTRLESRCV